MKHFFSLFALCASLYVGAQTTVVLPSNTQIITRDTVVMSDTPPGNTPHYLVCPGTTLWESANVTSFAVYYQDSGSVVKMDTNCYTFIKSFMQGTATFTGNGSLPGASGTIDTIIHETPVTITDTAGMFVRHVASTPSLTFDYSNLPGGVGCPSTTGLVKLDKQSVLAWPNPAKEQVFIRLNDQLTNVEIQAVSMTGKLVELPYELNGTLIKLNTADLANGLYTVLINSGRSQYSTRVLVQQ